MGNDKPRRNPPGYRFITIPSKKGSTSTYDAETGKLKEYPTRRDATDAARKNNDADKKGKLPR